MGTTLNRHAFQRLIDEDLEWLLKQPRTLERDHIEAIVRNSPAQQYEECVECGQPRAFCKHKLRRCASKEKHGLPV
jgi:RNA:NAD 2'-phosphotransferase (TPT1/KptA family)